MSDDRWDLLANLYIFVCQLLIGAVLAICVASVLLP